MKARHLATAVTASTAVALLTMCAPKTVAPVPVRTSSVQYVRIDNTPTGIAWCNSRPGGAPEWQTASDGTRILVCRIVP